MAKRKIKPEQQLKEAVACIKDGLQRWLDIAQNGSSDPFYADGIGMNLCRNHVIYGQTRVLEICEEYGLTIPLEYRLPVPPYVDANFFAFPESERAQRIMGFPSWKSCNHVTPQDPSVFLGELLKLREDKCL